MQDKCNSDMHSWKQKKGKEKLQLFTIHSKFYKSIIYDNYATNHGGNGKNMK